MSLEFVRLATDADIVACIPVIRQLRPALDESGFAAYVRHLETGGAHFVCARLGGAVVAVAGYRVLERIARDKQVLFVTDLVTDSRNRSGGVGRAMLAWLSAEGRRLGCNEIGLDTNLHRHRAQDFYLRERFAITAFHFTRALE